MKLLSKRSDPKSWSLFVTCSRCNADLQVFFDDLTIQKTGLPVVPFVQCMECETKINLSGLHNMTGFKLVPEWILWAYSDLVSKGVKYYVDGNSQKITEVKPKPIFNPGHMVNPVQ